MVVLLVAFGGAVGFFASGVQSSFLTDEDQGYAFVNRQLPNGASLERTTAAAADVRKILMRTPGVHNSTASIGFTLLYRVRSRYKAFFFVTFKPWARPTSTTETFQAIQS